MAHEEGGNIQAIAVKRRRLHSVYLAIHTMAQSLSRLHDTTLNARSWQAEFTELFKVSLELLFIVRLVTKAVHYVHQIDIKMSHKDRHYKPG